MVKRRELDPGLNSDSASIGVIVEHLQLWQSETRETIESLRLAREQVDTYANRLESPQAARQYVDFFTELLNGFADTIGMVTAELSGGVERPHADTLRQIAASAAREDDRCMAFRDKWVNKPLPYEDMRPLLSGLCSGVRDQLEDLGELRTAAAWLDVSGPLPTNEPRQVDNSTFDRRSLFTRLFGRKEKM